MHKSFGELCLRIWESENQMPHILPKIYNKSEESTFRDTDPEVRPALQGRLHTHALSCFKKGGLLKRHSRKKNNRMFSTYPSTFRSHLDCSDQRKKEKSSTFSAPEPGKDSSEVWPKLIKIAGSPTEHFCSKGSRDRSSLMALPKGQMYRYKFPPAETTVKM